MNLPRWSYTALWLFWGALFGIIEAVALVDDDRGDTLSEHIIGLSEVHPVLWAGLASFLLWLTWHLLAIRRK